MPVLRSTRTSWFAKVDYFPLAFSASGKASGQVAIALQEAGIPWFVDLKEILEDNHGNPHFDTWSRRFMIRSANAGRPEPMQLYFTTLPNTRTVSVSTKETNPDLKTSPCFI
jgi:hypothetical protein